MVRAPCSSCACACACAAGAPLAPLARLGGIFLDSCSNFASPSPAWSAVRACEWGFARLRVNQTTLHAELLRESTGDVADEFFIVKR